MEATILTLLATYGPTLLTIAGFVLSIIKVIASAKGSVAAIENKLDTHVAELEEANLTLAATMHEVMQENAQLKATMNELLTKIDHIERK